MAMPDHVLSSIFITGLYVNPDDRRKAIYTRDWEMGGVALNDPSQGLLVQEWTAEYLDDTLFVSAPNQLNRIPIFTGITSIKIILCFTLRHEKKLNIF